jgi:tetratricopeptide (TPR) repeat protein
MEELGDRAGLATTYNNIGLINEARGEYAAALEWYERSVALKEALGDRAGLATTYHNIASIHYARRNYVIALSWYEKARMLQEQLGDRYSNARTLYNVGLLYRDRGDLKQSFDALTHSLDVFAAIGLIQEVDTVKATRADVAYDLGRQYVQQGRWHDGLQLLADCLTIRQQGDDLDALANVIYQIGLTRHLMGDAEQARIRYRDALRLYEHTGNQRGVAACRAGLGRLAVQTGWLDGAIRELGRARVSRLAVLDLAAWRFRPAGWMAPSVNWGGPGRCTPNSEIHSASTKSAKYYA